MELPDWFTEDIPIMTDSQIAVFVRRAYALEAMRQELDRTQREQREHYWKVYRSLSLWQRFKVRIGLLTI